VGSTYIWHVSIAVALAVGVGIGPIACLAIAHCRALFNKDFLLLGMRGSKHFAFWERKERRVNRSSR